MKAVSASLVAAAGVMGCGSDNIMMGDTFSIHGLVSAHVNAGNSTFCDVSWLTQVNDNARPYDYSVTFSPSAGGPSTYTGTTTGTASVSLTFSGLNGGVSWAFTWDTLHASGSVAISSCAVH
jgi:hypothetical protein